MDRGQLWRVFVPATLRRLPTDLGLVTVYLGCATAVVVVPGLNQTVLRPMLALPLVLFVPGYLFVAVDRLEAVGADGRAVLSVLLRTACTRPDGGCHASTRSIGPPGRCCSPPVRRSPHSR